MGCGWSVQPQAASVSQPEEQSLNANIGSSSDPTLSVVISREVGRPKGSHAGLSQPSLNLEARSTCKPLEVNDRHAPNERTFKYWVMGIRHTKGSRPFFAPSHGEAFSLKAHLGRLAEYRGGPAWHDEIVDSTKIRHDRRRITSRQASTKLQGSSAGQHTSSIAPLQQSRPSEAFKKLLLQVAVTQQPDQPSSASILLTLGRIRAEAQHVAEMATDTDGHGRDRTVALTAGKSAQEVAEMAWQEHHCKPSSSTTSAGCTRALRSSAAATTRAQGRARASARRTRLRLLPVAMGGSAEPHVEIAGGHPMYEVVPGEGSSSPKVRQECSRYGILHSATHAWRSLGVAMAVARTALHCREDRAESQGQPRGNGGVRALLGPSSSPRKQYSTYVQAKHEGTGQRHEHEHEHEQHQDRGGHVEGIPKGRSNAALVIEYVHPTAVHPVSSVTSAPGPPRQASSTPPRAAAAAQAAAAAPAAAAGGTSSSSSIAAGEISRLRNTDRRVSVQLDHDQLGIREKDTGTKLEEHEGTRGQQQRDGHAQLERCPSMRQDCAASRAQDPTSERIVVLASRSARGLGGASSSSALHAGAPSSPLRPAWRGSRALSNSSGGQIGRDSRHPEEAGSARSGYSTASTRASSLPRRHRPRDIDMPLLFTGRDIMHGGKGVLLLHPNVRKHGMEANGQRRRSASNVTRGGSLRQRLDMRSAAGQLKSNPPLEPSIACRKGGNRASSLGRRSDRDAMQRRGRRKNEPEQLRKQNPPGDGCNNVDQSVTIAIQTLAGGSLQDEPTPMPAAPVRLHVFEKSTGGLAAGQAVELEVPIEESGALRHRWDSHHVHSTSVNDGIEYRRLVAREIITAGPLGDDTRPGEIPTFGTSGISVIGTPPDRVEI